MANLAKYAAAAAKPLIRHVVRQHKNYRNKNIDPTLTGCNYSLCPDRGSSVRYYNRVLQDVHHINRDNVVTLCSWTVSLPSELKKATEEQEREFFKTAYDFVLNRYFGNNEKFVVAAEVHNDEVYREVQTDRWTGAPIIGENGKAVLSFEARTPHLQILFVPAIEDGKHGGYKLGAKYMLDRADLRSWHNDFQAAVTAAGIDANAHNGQTRGKGIPMAELKLQHVLERHPELAVELSTEMERDLNA